MDDVTSPKGEPLTLNKRIKTLLMLAKVFVSTPGLDPTSGAGVEGEELGCLNGTVGNLTRAVKRKSYRSFLRFQHQRENCLGADQ